MAEEGEFRSSSLSCCRWGGELVLMMLVLVLLLWEMSRLLERLGRHHATKPLLSFSFSLLGSPTADFAMEELAWRFISPWQRPSWPSQANPVGNGSNNSSRSRELEQALEIKRTAETGKKKTAVPN